MKLWKNSIYHLPTYFDNQYEDNLFLKTTDFARMAKESDNYFVIITREDTKKIYNEFYHIYGSEELSGEIRPDEIIVEEYSIPGDAVNPVY